MNLKSIRFSALVGILICSSPNGSAASGDTLIERTPRWHIVSRNVSGGAKLCLAKIQIPGPFKFAIVKRGVRWGASVTFRRWPKVDRHPVPSSLAVNGKPIRVLKAVRDGRSVKFLFASRDDVEMIAKGSSLSFKHDGRLLRYDLRGSRRAIVALEKCSEFNRSAPALIVAKPDIDKAESTRSPQPITRIANRTDTLSIARDYLESQNQRYKILKTTRSPLSTYPVNWQTDEGMLGAMVVLSDEAMPPYDHLKIAIERRDRRCKGRVGGTASDVRVAAVSLCPTPSGKKRSYYWQALRLNPTSVAIVVETALTAADER